jgi:molybdopterin molybdotransferase
VLESDVLADVDMPPFDRCAMDGFAVRAQDVATAPSSLKVVGVVAAGQAWEHEPVGRGQAVQVMTGAPLPAGCDAVVPVERTGGDGGRVLIYEAATAGQHVAPRAEDLCRGARALAAGALIGPVEIGLLAAVGRAEVPVHARPVATVVSTGDELVEVGDVPGPARLRNSNGPMLGVLARSLGCDPVRVLPAVRDRTEDLRAALAAGLEGDVLLVSGGVSRGERDLVGEVLEGLGVERVFHGVSIQPGKPLWFGRRGGALVFALPGNPVSALVCARLFAGLAVARLRGLDVTGPPLLPARLTVGFERAARREGWLPARVEAGEGGLDCRPLRPRGSADLVTAAGANALWVAPAGCERFRPGDAVRVLLAPDHLER